MTTVHIKASLCIWTLLIAENFTESKISCTYITVQYAVKSQFLFHPQSPHLRPRMHLSRQHRWRPDLLPLLSQVLLPGGGGRRIPVPGGKEAQGDGEVN